MIAEVNQVWARNERLKPLKSNRQVSVLDTRQVWARNDGEGPSEEVLIERFYPHTGRYRRTWIKEFALLIDYTLQYEQERLA